jgi:quinol-cytochrome oxidoreductase complex cytochrome b subunit
MLDFFSKFNPANPTWDLMLILFFVAATFLYGLTLGRARVVVQIVASYMTMGLLSAAPFLDKIEARTPLNHTVFYVAVFLTVFVLLCLLLSKSAFHQHLSEGRGSWADVLILSVVQVGFLTSIVLSATSGLVSGHLSTIGKMVFINEPAPFVWTVLPIGALVLIRGKREKRF